MSEMNSVMHSRPFRLALVGFIAAVIGVGVGFAGWYAISDLAIARLGFVLAVLGVLLGFIGVVWGQVKHGGAAIAGSLEAAKGLRRKFLERIGKRRH
jgi:hypothetical protein